MGHALTITAMYYDLCIYSAVNAIAKRSSVRLSAQSPSLSGITSKRLNF